MDMDDKWLIEFSDPWLYFRRSWTGNYIYGVRFGQSPDGASVAESGVTRDRTQYRGTSKNFDRALLEFLIQRALLGREWEYPRLLDYEPDT